MDVVDKNFTFLGIDHKKSHNFITNKRLKEMSIKKQYTREYDKIF